MCSPHDLDLIEARYNEGKNDMKSERERMLLQLTAARNETKQLLKKIEDSVQLLKDMEIDLQLHNVDDLSAAIMKAQFAAALPAGTPRIDQIGQAATSLVSALMVEREKMTVS